MSNDHNADNLALQQRIGELEAVIVQRDDQLRELQQQLAEMCDDLVEAKRINCELRKRL